jgi:hypothetical protein
MKISKIYSITKIQYSQSMVTNIFTVDGLLKTYYNSKINTFRLNNWKFILMITQKQIRLLKKRFYDYVNQYYGLDEYTDQLVRIKDFHSRQVCTNCIAIAKSLNLSQSEINIAELIGLYHDIGRFEQLKRYQSLNDKSTVCHGKLGVVVSELEGFFKILDSEVQDVMCKCILFHSHKELPKIVDDKTIFYLKILRDADKLDILYVLTRYYSSERKTNSNPALNHDLPDIPDISAEVVADVMKNRCVDSRNVRSINDSIILHLSWIFDLNYHYTFKEVLDNEYLGKMLEVLPKTDTVQQIGEYVLCNLLERINREGV